MSQLSREQQNVLHLSVHHGLTHDQIAQQLDLPLGTVKTHARRGLLRLREWLATEPPPQGQPSRMGVAT